MTPREGNNPVRHCLKAMPDAYRCEMFQRPMRGGAAMLEIAPEKVAHVIIKAREYGVRVSAWNSTLQEGDAEEDPQAILEDLAHDVTGRELTSFINALNEDEQSHLVALAWIGRGTFEPEELAEAVETARSERINSTARYLLGMPLLADYLEEGLEKMGYSVEDVESDVL
jgi:Protein of unknown function (DUF3775)